MSIVKTKTGQPADSTSIRFGLEVLRPFSEGLLVVRVQNFCGPLALAVGLSNRAATDAAWASKVAATASGKSGKGPESPWGETASETDA